MSNVHSILSFTFFIHCSLLDITSCSGYNNQDDMSRLSYVHDILDQELDSMNPSSRFQDKEHNGQMQLMQDDPQVYDNRQVGLHTAQRVEHKRLFDPIGSYLIKKSGWMPPSAYKRGGWMPPSAYKRGGWMPPSAYKRGGWMPPSAYKRMFDPIGSYLIRKRLSGRAVEKRRLDPISSFILKRRAGDVDRTDVNMSDMHL